MLTSTEKLTLATTALFFALLVLVNTTPGSLIKAGEPITPITPPDASPSASPSNTPTPSPRFCKRLICPDGGTQQLINGKCGCAGLPPTY